MTTRSTRDGTTDRSACWCCGQHYVADDLVHLGEHPEVEVCLRCAHFLHQQARGREDARTRSPLARVRDGMRRARVFVMHRDLQHKPVIGPVLRWLGPRLP